jgi:DNA-directed RNA polymerase III subunit RPC5
MVGRSKSRRAKARGGDADVLQSNADVSQPEGGSNSEEDEVVREIEVFLSPELADQISLLQYPLAQQPVGLPAAARIKPRHYQIEVEHSLPDEMTPNGQYHMPTRKYSSSTIPITTHLALGKMIDHDKFHLVPLSRIAQMRPSFAHVDEANAGPSSPANSEDEASRQKAEDTKLARKPLAFQKKETERAALARKSSFAYKKASIESEAWQQLHVHTEDSPQHGQTVAQIPCPSRDQKNALLYQKSNAEDNLESNNYAYIQSLNYLPSAKSENEETTTVKSTNPSSLAAKLTNLLQEGKPTPFSLLRKQFPAFVSNQSLFEALESCAVLLRGNFILQSRLCPLQPAVAQARTFILFLMQMFQTVHRSRLELVYKDDDAVNTEALLLILTQVAIQTEDGWKPKVDDGVAFVEQFPEIANLHMQFWSTQLRRFGPLLEKYQQT